MPFQGIRTARKYLTQPDFIRRRKAPDVLVDAFLGSVRDTLDPSLGELTHGMDKPQVLPPIGLDNDRRLYRQRLILGPVEEFLAIAFEGDFYEDGQRSKSRRREDERTRRRDTA